MPHKEIINVFKGGSRDIVKGVKGAVKGIGYALGGGEYGKRQEERIKKTRQGRKNLEEIKKGPYKYLFKKFKGKVMGTSDGYMISK